MNDTLTVTKAVTFGDSITMTSGVIHQF